MHQLLILLHAIESFEHRLEHHLDNSVKNYQIWFAPLSRQK